MTPANLVCLLPARNCEDDLGGFFTSVRRFADSVVALDDGSTDGTRSALAAEPLVKTLLTNPPRQSFKGWNDSANRNRLLKAAGDLSPDWIISLDADERLDEDDGAALRELIETQARGGFAYALRVFRMLEDLYHYDLDRPWVGRLFAFEPGQTFGDSLLHFRAVPRSIPSERVIKTTIRIQHLAGLSEARRRERFAKYAEVDPMLRWQRGYEHLLRPPARVKRWRPRPAQLPLLKNQPASHNTPRDGKEEFDLTVLLLSRPEADAPVPPLSGRVEVVELDPTFTSEGVLEKALRDAKGRFVLFARSARQLTDLSTATRVQMHERGYAMVTGAAANRTHTPSGWARYFLESSRALPGAPPSAVRNPELDYSYLRAALQDAIAAGVNLLWEADIDRGALNTHLLDLGYAAYRHPDITVPQDLPAYGSWPLLSEQFHLGRRRFARLWDDYAGRGETPPRKVIHRRVIQRGPRRMLRVIRDVGTWGRGQQVRFLSVSPLVAVGVAAEWTGMVLEWLSRRAREKRWHGD